MKRNIGRIGQVTCLLVMIGLVMGFQPSFTPVAVAHANIVRSEPAQNSVLEQSPPDVTIWFTERLAPEFGEIQVLDSLGRRVDEGDSAVGGQDPTVMSVSLPSLPNGTYVVAWTNVSTVDGHKVRGSFLFSVGEPISAASLAEKSSQTLLQSPLEPVLRWLTLLSALAVVGGLGFERLILRPVLRKEGAPEILHILAERLTSRALKFTWLALGLLLAASIGHLLLQTMITYELPLAQILGSPLTAILLGTSWGFFLLWRLGLVLILPAVLDLALVTPAQNTGRQARFHRLALAVTIAAGAGLLLTLSLTSHAAATAEVRAAAIFNDYLHLLAASFWVGGLFLFALTLPVICRTLSGGQRREVLLALARRFSLLAGLSVFILTVTGLYSTWAQVTILPAMGTPYGQALLVKLGLLIFILGLAAVNLLWVRPRLAGRVKASRWLRRLVTAEAVLAILLLLPVGLLVALEPARQVASREGLGQEQSLVFDEMVEGTGITVRIEPGQVGPNRLLVSLEDRRGRPISNASDVSLRASYLEADLGESAVSATGGGDGQYVINDLPLTIAGPWQVELVVRRPDAFDARTAFRFEVLTGGDLGSATISPAAATGQRLWAAELALLGMLIIGAGLRFGGRRTRPGAAVALPGLVVAGVGIVLAYNSWLIRPERPEVAPAVTLSAASGSAAANEQPDQQPDIAKVSLRNPFPPDPTSLAVGQKLFEQHCTPCHGLTGRGDGLLADGLAIPPADLLTHIPLHADIELFRIVRDGKSFSPMPSFESIMTTEEIWHLVNYLRAFKVDQSLAEDYYQAGVELIEQDAYEQALTSFNEAIELSPRHVSAYIKRGIVYRNLADYEQAIADHSQAIALKPNLAEAYFNRGVDYNEAHQSGLAIPDYTKALELEPDYSSAYYARGLAFADTGDLEQAIRDFDTALELYPDFIRVYLDRSLAYYDTGNLDQAMSDLEQYLKLAPDAEERNAVTALLTQLQARLSSAQTAPPSTKMVLTLADFPSGFEAIPPAELGLAEGNLIDNGATIASSFAFGDVEHFELVWGFTRLIPTGREQANFDARLTPDNLLVFLKEGIGDATIQKQEKLPILADLGDASLGLTVVVGADDLQTRVDGVAFRKGAIGAFVFVMYADGHAPPMPVGYAARKLASRLVANEISDTSLQGDQ